MGNNLERFEELERLLNALTDDQLDAAGHARVGELLDGDPEACEFYLDFISLHAHLEQELGAVKPLQFFDKLPQAQIEEATTVYLATRQPPPPPLWKQPWTLAAAAAVAIGAMVIGLVLHSEKDAAVADQVAASARDNAVAVLTESVDAKFLPGGLQPARGDLLPKGTLRLESGLLRLQFYSGAQVILEGPVEFDLRGDNLAACKVGNFRASVPRMAQGFTVISPLIEMVDLGTEFGARIEPSGAIEVHVFEGEVEVYRAGSNRAPETRQLLTAGYGLQVSSDGTRTDTLADSMAFISEDEVFQRMRNRAEERRHGWEQFVARELADDARVMAHYPFERDDAARSTLSDHAAIGGLRDGTIIGCQWVSGRWPGKRALGFTKPSDRVRISMKERSDSLTMLAWVKVDRLDQRYSALLVTDRLKRGGVEWQITRAGALQFGLRENERETENYTSPVVFGPKNLGKWMHVGVCFDNEARVVRHFLDGEMIGWQPMRSKLKPVIGAAEIGNWNAPREDDSYPVRNLQGRIDDLLIYKVALTEDEIAQLHAVSQP